MALLLPIILGLGFQPIFDFFNPPTNEFTVCFQSFHPLNSLSVFEVVVESFTDCDIL